MKIETMFGLYTNKMTVSFRIACLARDKGFNLTTWEWYEDKSNYFYEKPHPDHKLDWNNNFENTVSAPSQSKLQRWLREVHNIHIWINPISLGNFKYHLFKDGGYIFSKDGYESYESAMEDVLENALCLIHK